MDKIRDTQPLFIGWAQKTRIILAYNRLGF